MCSSEDWTGRTVGNGLSVRISGSGVPHTYLTELAGGFPDLRTTIHVSTNDRSPVQRHLQFYPSGEPEYQPMSVEVPCRRRVVGVES